MPDYPSLYEINTRVMLNELSSKLGRQATLDDFPDSELERLAKAGFKWIWLLGVWQTGKASRQVSRQIPELRAAYRAALPDVQDEDICGSCFAITGYTVPKKLGGELALARLRERMARCGLRLMLDFVPNHVALDHPWVGEHPEYFIHGTVEELQKQPEAYYAISSGAIQSIFAHGRDPYFPAWTDTLQLNYAEPALWQAMQQELVSIAERSDGVRCDMAMLILPEVFQRTWGLEMAPFWPEALRAARQANPQFVSMAEVYWDMEWALQQQGFSYTYDKRLYDRLRDEHAPQVRAHLQADMDYQEHMARFLENHDEPRAAATFSFPQHQAAAIVTYLTPGLRFFHEGQFEGRPKFLPVHLCRRPAHRPERGIRAFYNRLLKTLHSPVVRQGRWELLECWPAWEENWSWENFIGFAWHGLRGELWVGVINYGPRPAQCYLQLPFPKLGGRTLIFKDRLSTAQYERQGDDLLARGLYLDLPGWGYHLFQVK
jgi:glycosidase